jgi:hypothetical protein
VTVGGSASVTISAVVLASFNTTRLNFSGAVPLSDPLLRALEAESAAMALESMTAEQSQKLAINPALAGSFRAQAEKAIYWENVRRSRQQTTETVARGR